MPSLEIPCPQSGVPGHAGIDGHAALHLNPPEKHRRHTLCLQLSSPFDHWRAGIKQANAWSCRFRKLPFLNLSLGEWQARPGPHRQVPTLPSSCQPASTSLGKPGLTPHQAEGRNLPPHPPPSQGPGTGGTPAMSGGFSRSGTVTAKKKKLDSFRASDSSLTPGITEIPLRPLARQCSRNSTTRPPLTTCPGSPRRKKWPSRVDPSVTGHASAAWHVAAWDGEMGEPSLLRPNQDLDSRLFSRAHSSCFGWLSILAVAIFLPVGWAFASIHHPPRSPAFSSQWLLSP